MVIDHMLIDNRVGTKSRIFGRYRSILGTLYAVGDSGLSGSEAEADRSSRHQHDIAYAGR